MAARLHRDLGSGETLCQLECSATADPIAGAVPLSVQFSGLAEASSACVGDITFDWDFGDQSEHSSEQNPSHTYESTGAFDWVMTASLDFVDCTATGTVEVGPPIAFAGEHTYLIAAAAHVAGSVGTNWVTDAVLHNPGEQDAGVQLFYMKHGEDNTWSEAVTAAVPAGSSLELEDVVAATFDRAGTTGAVMIGSDTALLISSRTYNDADSGSYGQYIPGLALESAFTGGDQPLLLQLTGDDDFRTNIGLVNPGGKPIDMVVDLAQSDGTAVDSLSATVEPFSVLQLNRVFASKADVEDAYATVAATTEQAAFFTYASVVDNRSGDPMYVAPVPAVADVLYIPASAHVGGAAGTDWRTDLEVYSAAEDQASFRVDFLPAFLDNRDPESEMFTLDAGSSVRYRDVLDSVFEFSGSGALRVAVGAGAVMVTSRTYNRPGDLTYGQFIAGTTLDQALEEGQEGFLIQLSHSPANDQGFRTNIGVASATGESIEVEVDLFSGDGTQIGTRTYTLLPYSYYQETNIFAEATADAVDNGFAVVRSETAGAMFFAYASVVDNRSGDPIYIPARLTQ
jgi:hypothetical protein